MHRREVMTVDFIVIQATILSELNPAYRPVVSATKGICVVVMPGRSQNSAVPRKTKLSVRNVAADPAFPSEPDAAAEVIMQQMLTVATKVSNHHGTRR